MIYKIVLLMLCLWLPVSCSAETASSSSDQVEQVSFESIHNFHQVTDLLLTSGQVEPKHIEALQAAGVEMVINLAPASEKRNRDEGFLLTQQGINYVQIPVAWENPTDSDLQIFFAVMAARKERKTLVHCFANYRASAFTYLYRVLEEGVPETEARADLHKIWNEEAFVESSAWRTFIDRHLAAHAAASEVST